MNNSNLIATQVGGLVDPLNLTADDIYIDDIAHALSNLCRFGGHTRRFYSVAEHSIHVSYLCDPADAMTGLLHDAAEAYLMDLPRPIKQRMPAYINAEAEVWKVIMSAFELQSATSVGVADEGIIDEELAVLFGIGTAPFTTRIACYPPVQAKQMFLCRYWQLYVDKRNRT